MACASVPSVCVCGKVTVDDSIRVDACRVASCEAAIVEAVIELRHESKWEVTNDSPAVNDGSALYIEATAVKARGKG